MQAIIKRIAGVMALTLMVGLAACGGDDDSNDAAVTDTTVAAADDTAADAVAALEADPAAQEVVAADEQRTTYVGTVEGAESDAYIAIVDHGDGVITAYVCDGAKIGAWAVGERTGNEVSATGASGLQVDATVRGSTVSGMAVVPGWGSHPFTATEASYPAGLWQPYDTESGEFAGLKVGWVVLDDGSQRGLALTPQKKVEIVKPVDTAAGPAGSSTAGPVTTGTDQCQFLRDMWQKGWRTFALNDEDSSLSKSGGKLMKLVEGLWAGSGCSGSVSSSS